MFKRLFLPSLLTIIFALFLGSFIIIGYPVNSAPTNPPQAQTTRCFGIGDLSNYITCLANGSPRLSRSVLVNAVKNSLNQQYRGTATVLTIALVLALIATLVVIWL